ncbi:MAG: hypothetical protein RLZZ04_4865, partial [Cyanobacteriota bacterium]
GGGEVFGELLISNLRGGLVLTALVAAFLLAAMLLVWFVFGGLDLLISTIEELNDLQRGYGVWQAMRHMLYIAPRQLYELLPASALIGALAGLGSLVIFPINDLRDVPSKTG